jgi:DNA-directed RNA polymerase II subunit RPB2
MEYCGITKEDIDSGFQKLLVDFFNTKSFAAHHLESFDVFIFEIVPTIIQELGNIVISRNNFTHRIKMLNTSFQSPTVHNSDNKIYQLFLTEALQRKLTYAIGVHVDIEHQIQKNDTGEIFFKRFYYNTLLCQIPCMVGSKLCYVSQRYPPAMSRPASIESTIFGYFIVSGQEKIIVSQETMRHNWPCCTMMSNSSGILRQAKCEIRSMNPKRWRSTSTLVMSLSQNQRRGFAFTVNIPFFTFGIDLYVIFAAIGVTSVSEICQMCGFSEKSVAMQNKAYVEVSKSLSEVLESQRLVFLQKVMAICQDNRPVDQLAVIYITHLHGSLGQLQATKVASGYMGEPKLVDISEELFQSDVDFNNKPESNEVCDMEINSDDDGHSNECFNIDGSFAECLENDADVISGPDTDGETVPSVQNQFDGTKQMIQILNNEFFPHIGLDESSLYKKAIFLGSCVAKQVRVFSNVQEPDDRDNYINKRIQPAGILLATLFRQIFRRTMSQLSLHLVKVPVTQIVHENLTKFCEIKQISSSLRYSLATGNWGILKAGCTIVGISQSMCRDRLAIISHIRRINSNLNRDGKQSKPRQLDESHFGIICPCETPEGTSSGLVKALSLLATVQTNVCSKQIIDQLLRLIPTTLFKPFKSTIFNNCIPVLVNGYPIGSVSNDNQTIDLFCKKVRKMRDSFIIPSLVSVCKGDYEIQINCDHGTIFRPIFNLKRLRRYLEFISTQKKKLWNLPGSWDDMVRRRIISFVDKQEDSSMFIAANVYDYIYPNVYGQLKNHNGSLPKFAEIHPTAFLGIPVSTIPFPEMDQAPRLIYGSCMMKQAMGTPGYDFLNRCDQTTNQLKYTQSPIVQTIGQRVVNTVDIPTGCNAVVLIAMHNGWNMEDAIVINRASVDRGLFDVDIYHTYTDEVVYSSTGLVAQINSTSSLKKKDSIVEIESSEEQYDCQRFGIPDVKKVLGLKCTDYSKLDEDGFPSPGTILKNGDPIIGKIITGDVGWAVDKKQISSIDQTTVLHKPHDNVTVFSVTTTNTPANNRLVHVTTVNSRPVAVGDKFGSLHAQKGICSRLEDPENMPFSITTGMVPDMIINPCAFPSRMTIGQLQESLFGKAAALSGKIADGTAFIGHDTESVRKVLHDAGFSTSGNEKFRCGETGEFIEGELQMGLVYYQRLKHMVKDKIHGRARGPVNEITRQPPHGRSKNGGFRLGEMERDVLIAHGAAGFLTDRYLYNSDAYQTALCKKCGQIAIPCRPNDAKFSITAEKAHCRTCNSSDTVVNATIPYCMKLLMQELQAMNIITELHLD